MLRAPQLVFKTKSSQQQVVVCDPRLIDTFALGCIFYEVLVGRKAFTNYNIADRYAFMYKDGLEPEYGIFKRFKTGAPKR